MELTHIGLFSGIGGDALAARWAGFRTLALCEKDEYCRMILRRNWPDVMMWEDIKNVSGEELESIRRAAGGRPITLISGGYPCQGESLAGQRGGADDDRWLWPEMLRLVRALRPTWVVGENVTGHATMGLPGVLVDLESAGYRAQGFLIPACAIGALHKRERVFIVAHAPCQQLEEPLDIGRENRRRSYPQPAGSGEMVADSDHGRLLYPPDPLCSGGLPPDDGRPVADPHSHGEPKLPRGIKEGRDGAADRSKTLADPAVSRVEGVRAEGQQEPEIPIEEVLSRWDGARGGAGNVWWQVEPAVGRVVNGLSSRVDRYIHRRRLEALGNAIVPQQIYPIFRTIALIEGGRHGSL